MFERFTDDARRVVVLAQEEARLLDHNWIGTEHLLLAVIHQGGVVAEALEPFGLTIDRVRAEVEHRTTPESAHGAAIPFTHDAKKAMELALREALKLGDRSITSAHLMLGVLEVEGCLGLQIVADVSDDVDEIKSWLKENRRIRTEPAEEEGPTVDRSGCEQTRPMRLLMQSHSGAPSATGTSGRSRRAWPARVSPSARTASRRRPACCARPPRPGRPPPTRCRCLLGSSGSAGRR